MDLLLNSIFAVFGLCCLGLAIWHEMKWWRRKSWIRTNGRVIEIVRQSSNGESSYHAKVEFPHEEASYTFTSEYGGAGCPKVGKQVTVLYDSTTLDAEYLSHGNRWIFTIVPIAFGVGFLWAGIAADFEFTDNTVLESEVETIESDIEIPHRSGVKTN